ncbi:unnamed protein product [Rangifer tarandus platyrhynchus]|uniref:Uncharacterized protein n=1 Tax=Rangifer tarandus platyrhynchus TaxID=3082113 RepID=A0AC59YJ20_RANTA
MLEPERGRLLRRERALLPALSTWSWQTPQDCCEESSQLLLLLPTHLGHARIQKVRSLLRTFFFPPLQGLETLLKTRWVENGYGRDSGCVRILEKALASDAMILLIIKSCASVISILKSSFGSGYFIRQFQKPASDRTAKISELGFPLAFPKGPQICVPHFSFLFLI